MQGYGLAFFLLTDMCVHEPCHNNDLNDAGDSIQQLQDDVRYPLFLKMIADLRAKAEQEVRQLSEERHEANL